MLVWVDINEKVSKETIELEDFQLCNNVRKNLHMTFDATLFIALW